MINIAERDVQNAPKGRLRIAHNHGNAQYYYVSENTDYLGKYIRKKNCDFIHLLAQKDYARKTIETLEQKKKILCSIKDTILDFDENKVYRELNEDRKKLVSPYYISDKEYIEKWNAEVYETKPFQEEQQYMITERGERVRSKSEKMIADKLLMLGVPYKYERPLYLSRIGVVYPDFTLLDITNREDVVLEHFGMMDNNSYCENAIRKINGYQRNGYYPGKNFLYTFETYKNPVDIKNFEIMIRNRFHL